MSRQPKILILTAAFGEGHNSAARNLALALGSAGAGTMVADPCMLSAPHSTSIIQWLYRIVTTHFPKVWEQIYKGTDNCDFSRPNLPLMHRPESYLGSLVTDYRPDAIVSTYPVYPYFLHRLFMETGNTVPVFTVVTDSIEINASWLRAPTDWFLVTDRATVAAMHTRNIPEEKIVTTGFPVNPSFPTLPTIDANDGCKPFRSAPKTFPFDCPRSCA